MTQVVAAKGSLHVPVSQAVEVAAKPPPLPQPRMIVIPERLAAGSVLLMPGTVLPPAIGVARRRTGDWDLVRGLNGFSLDRRLREAGWYFFFLAGPIEASSIGFDPERTFASALRRITRAVQAERFNAFEVTAVERRRWLGMHYVSITGHARHVRNNPYIRDLNQHHYPKGLWNFQRMFTTRNRHAPHVKAM